MEEDKFALVEKIIKDIDNVMSKNAELCSFDIVPVESNFQNKSPVLHLENCLGLESWCVKHVYMYCYTELMDKYFSKPKRKSLKVTSVMSGRLTRILNVTLLLNPELTSLWNKRRDLVLKMLLEKSSELRFTRLVLSRKPKCNDAFAYRRWLLDAILKDDNLQSNYIENLANEELHICELASDKSPNNYHSWNHRTWVMNKLKKYEKQFDLNFLYVKEYDFSERWSSKHVSDFSCFHYRQFCIKNIFTISNNSWKSLETSINGNLRKTFVRVLALHFPKDFSIQASENDLISYTEDNLVNLLLSYTVKNCNCITNNSLVCRKLEILFHEMVLNNELLRYYKYHETLWYHRRFIIHEIIAIMYEYYGVVRQNGALVKNVCKKCNLDEIRQKQPKMGRYDGERVYSSILFKVTLAHEMNYIQERRNDNDNYADRHEKYLKFVEGLNNSFST
ncbi:protein prenyltransferase alpha subunit repeat-containing protein 1 [Pectinophora gossypiella]|uniref:protein prenyltransferase alpha subunit repeat-containing protein 1 n=1 Tax=Pectinophora gossypiella TaxID=13191 RepID=UPI00214ECA52|nr:protein prenyltransferase alpha subunit repeat-containing protein 1 [Pectinophora gossypiella]